MSVGATALPFVLDSLLRVERVEVVQSLDHDKLSAALHWLADGLARSVQPEALADLDKQVKALQADEKVAEELKRLGAQQDALRMGLEAVVDRADRAQAALQELRELPKQVDQLKAEVALLQSNLEDGNKVQQRLQQQLAAAQHTQSSPNAAAQDAPASHIAADTRSAAGSVSPDALAALQSDVDDLKAKQDELDRQHEGLALSGSQLSQEQARLRQASAERQAEADAMMGQQANAMAGLADELAALRAAVQAVGEGEPFVLPPAPVPMPPLDLAPLERRIAAKADADELSSLAQRLRDLEQGMQGLRPIRRTDSQTRSAQHTHDDAAARVPQLDADLRALEHDLSDALDRCRSQLLDQGSVLEHLQNSMQGVRQDLADKASRSELDAVVHVLAPGSSASTDATPVLQLQAGPDGQVDVGSINDALDKQASRLRSLEAVLVLLQERVGASASLSDSGLTDLRDGHSAHEARLVKLETAVPMRRSTSISRAVAANSDAHALQNAVDLLQRQMAAVQADVCGKAGQEGVDSLRADLHRLTSQTGPDLRAFDKLRQDLAQLQQALTDKADAGSLQDLALQVAFLSTGPAAASTSTAAAVNAPAAPLEASLVSGKPAAGPAAGPSANTASDGGVLAAVQGLVGAKAGKEDVALLRAQLADKADAGDLNRLQEALQQLQRDLMRDNASLLANVAELQLRVTRERVPAASQRSGLPLTGSSTQERTDTRASSSLSSSLDRDSSPLLGSNVGPAQAPFSSDPSTDLASLSEVQREVAALGAALEVVAQVAQVMALGPSAHGVASQQQHHHKDAKADHALPGLHALVDITDSLANALNNGDVRLKADAQGAMENGVLHPGTQEPGGVTSKGGLAAERPRVDVEKAIRMLRGEVASLRRKLAGSEAVTPRQPDGDYAMLAAKPLLGYRCMACDRPLNKLDDGTGPYVPSNYLPTHTTMDLAKSNGIRRDELPPTVVQRKSQALVAEASRSQLPGDTRGPQHWYKDKHGAPADALPREDVGPQLPAGGWRQTAPQQRATTAHAPRRKGLAQNEELAGWDTSHYHKLPQL